MKKAFSVLLFSIISVFTFAQSPSVLWASSKKQTIVVTPTITHDGDGFTVKSGDMWTGYRFIGVDAPEVFSNFIDSTQAYGREAGDYLRSLIKGQKLTVQLRGSDKYKRKMVNVALNGEDIVLKLIESGYAHYTPSKYLTKKQRTAYTAAQLIAKQQGLNIWSQPNPVLPSEWRKKHARKQPRKKFLGLF